ncbi:nSTAND1 domain-containing NTPase [Methylotetracoccus oryzae]|uniref:nSTAND1 domain-containing NTPase n=1 Tax=Methylotetracoccus oryzae TaxID=1919059 RepID=UPI00111918D0|nr:SUMF1/EgtB/PvdO family nonheme iron enzyme [Methylotetracoccus oryzae]
MDMGNDDRQSLARADQALEFKIFLASPGDVPLERKLAREAIAHVSGERRFRGRLKIEIVAWDQPGAAVAMEAGLTPQEAIAQGLPKPEDCDLAVVVLWSRIGTQLPADFELKEDGSPYLSGTEWEYLNALKGYRTHRKPAVWIYRRIGAPNIAANDPERNLKLDQWDKLERFFSAFTNPDGSLRGGINQYEAPEDFRLHFEGHLRDRLDKLLENLPPPAANSRSAAPAPRWTESPYPGLAAFAPEQAPIFFGRGREVDQLLSQFSDPEVRFVAVVGVSGSGKSSLVRAGLVPRLRAGIVGNAPWIDLCFKPGERGGNPFLALAFALKATLGLTGRNEAEIARALQSDYKQDKPKEAERHFQNLRSLQPVAAELLLLIDQFEEVFTQTSKTDREDFIDFMQGIVALPGVRVIITLRADFFGQAIDEPALAKLLRRDRGAFPLDPPGVGALHEMIVRPAEAAALELQPGLAHRLLDDSMGEGPGAMALIAFTLNELYTRRAGQSIGLSDYDTLGGVKGAVQTRAEVALRGLPTTALPELFGALVEFNEREVATRRRVPKTKLGADAQVLADALVDARLLVTAEDEARQPTYEVAHETVLGGWKDLHDWIGAHAKALRARRDLERVAEEWEKANRHASALRTGRLLRRYLCSAEPRTEIAEAYLAACRRRRLFFGAGYAALFMATIAGFAMLFYISKSQFPPALAAKGLLAQWGLWPVRPPTMVPIPAGQFDMGDANGLYNEQPVHKVRFGRLFEIGKFEVTFAEYDLFAAATARYKPDDKGWGRGDRPVINVSWDDAVAYAAWLKERTGLSFRLPTESEWEYAARAASNTPRYWQEIGVSGNDDPACRFANIFDRENEFRIKSAFPGVEWKPLSCADGYPFTSPVGSFQSNDWKLHDMLGNVVEWTQDCYLATYEEASRDGTAWEGNLGEECTQRVARGGSWGLDPRFARSSARLPSNPDFRTYFIGFRLARTP